MKNFLKKPSKTKDSNVLIDYTKWLFKIVIMLILLLGIGFILIIFGDKALDKYEQSEELVTYMSCVGKNINGEKPLENEKRHYYKITKQKKSKKPNFVYSPNTLYWNFDEKKLTHFMYRTDDASTIENFSDHETFIFNEWITEMLDENDEIMMPKYYIFRQTMDFGKIEYDFINRDTLERYRFRSGQKLPIRKFDCEIGGENEYKAEYKKLTKSIKNKLKI